MLTGTRNAMVALVCIAGLTGMALLAGCGDGAGDGGAAQASAAGGETVTLEFEVGEMYCDGCAFTVRQAVVQLDGVKSCDVSYADGMARVEVVDAGVAERIIEAVEAAEFTIKAKN